MGDPVDTGRNGHGQFVPGHPPTPGGGRPKGARSKLNEDFVRDFLTVWTEGGIDSLRKMQANDPARFVEAAIKLLPTKTETDVNVTHTFVDFLVELQQARRERAGMAGQPQTLRNGSVGGHA